MREDIVRISDLGLCAFLVAKGHEPLRAEGPSGRREVLFSEVPSTIIADYYAGRDDVSARLLNEARRQVRELLSGGRR